MSHAPTQEQIDAKLAADKVAAAAAVTAQKEATAAKVKAEKEAAKKLADEAKAKVKAEKEAATAKAKADKEAAAKLAAEEKAKNAETKVKVAQPSQNGVTRPRPEGACGKVWALADSISARIGQPVTIAMLSKETSAAGLNDATTRTQYARWKTFNGVFGAAPKYEEPVAVAVPETHHAHHEQKAA